MNMHDMQFEAHGLGLTLCIVAAFDSHLPQIVYRATIRIELQEHRSEHG